MLLRGVFRVRPAAAAASSSFVAFRSSFIPRFNAFSTPLTLRLLISSSVGSLAIPASPGSTADASAATIATQPHSRGADSFDPFQDIDLLAPRLHMPKAGLEEQHDLLGLRDAPPQDLDDIARAISINTANSRELRKMRVAELVKRFSRGPGDTGSSEVQIAVLTDQILHLEQHRKIHSRDIHLKRNLARIKERRYRLMLYLQRTHFERYRNVVRGLNIPVREPETRAERLAITEQRQLQKSSKQRAGGGQSAKELRHARRQARRKAQRQAEPASSAVPSA